MPVLVDDEWSSLLQPRHCLPSHKAAQDLTGVTILPVDLLQQALLLQLAQALQRPIGDGQHVLLLRRQVLPQITEMGFGLDLNWFIQSVVINGRAVARARLGSEQCLEGMVARNVEKEGMQPNQLDEVVDHFRRVSEGRLGQSLAE